MYPSESTSSFSGSHPNRIEVRWGPGQSVAALLLKGRVVELTLLRPGLACGGLYAGRVVEVSKALSAAFVDIGLAQPAFLPGAQGHGVGKRLLVQAVADPQGGKGARLSTSLALTGRYIAYTPGKPGLNASRKLEDEVAAPLIAHLQPLVSEDEGVILRTAAAQADPEDIAAEILRFRQSWQQVQGAVADKRDGCLIAPDPIAQWRAENPQVTQILVDDPLLCQSYPDAEISRTGLPLVDEALDEALTPTIPLLGGGKLHLDHARAAALFDVDSGGAPASQINDEAIPLVARQIRLRAIGGQILVDPVSVKSKGAAQQMAARLRQLTARDPTQTHVLGTSALGLIEMTRERHRAGLAESLLDTLACRLSAEAAAFDCLRALARQANGGRGKAQRLVCAPEVAGQIANLRQAKAETESRLGAPLTLRPDPVMSREGWYLEDVT